MSPALPSHPSSPDLHRAQYAAAGAVPVSGSGATGRAPPPPETTDTILSEPLVAARPDEATQLGH